MRNIIFAILLAGILCQAHAEPNARTMAEAVANEYSQAVGAADCEKVEALMSPVITSRYPTAPAVFCDVVQRWKNQGMVERIRVSTTHLSSKKNDLFVVPNIRYTVDGAVPVATESAYIVYANDGGKTWHVIDIGCASLKDWVKAVYPPYTGRPPIPKLKVSVMKQLD